MNNKGFAPLVIIPIIIGVVVGAHLVSETKINKKEAIVYTEYGKAFKSLGDNMCRIKCSALLIEDCGLE